MRVFFMSFPLTLLRERRAFDLTETLWQAKDCRNTARSTREQGFPGH